MKTISSRNLFLMQIFICGIILFLDLKFFKRSLPSLLLESMFTACIVALIHLNLRIFFPVRLPLGVGIYFLLMWPGTYFLIGTQDHFGQWANMYTLFFYLQGFVAMLFFEIFYPSYQQFKTTYELKAVMLSVCLMSFWMVISFFFPPLLALAPKIILATLLCYFFSVVIL